MRKLVLEAPYTLRMTDAPVPEPGAEQVRIRVVNIGVCGSDPTIYKGLHPYVSYPVVMGHEISGVIDAVGGNVPPERIGKRVTVIPHIVCGHCDACEKEIFNFCEQLKCTGAEADGAHCDYFCIESRMALDIPDSMTLEDAAMVEPACVGLSRRKARQPRTGGQCAGDRRWTYRRILYAELPRTGSEERVCRRHGRRPAEFGGESGRVGRDRRIKRGPEGGAYSVDRRGKDDRCVL